MRTGFTVVAMNIARRFATGFWIIDPDGMIENDHIASPDFAFQQLRQLAIIRPFPVPTVVKFDNAGRFAQKRKAVRLKAQRVFKSAHVRNGNRGAILNR